MNIRQLRGIREALNGFLRAFGDCIKTAPSRQHFTTYVNGQLSALERKSIEPIALEAGVAPRTLQEFLSLHRWDEDLVRRRIHEIVMDRHADDDAIAVIDETGYAKDGEKTPGVQRQYCGALGKIDNCVVTVHVGYVTETFHTLVDSDLFLPEETWAADRERCRAAGIPDAVTHRPKWRIALDLLARTMANGVRFRWLVADEEYGKAGEFRRQTAERGLLYVVEVPCSLRGWTLQGALDANTDARRVDALWPRGGPSWEMFHVKDTDKGPVVWEVRVARFHPREDGRLGEEGWLVVARHVLTGEVKYFLSNAPADTPRETLLHVAFSRYHIEHLFREAKNEIGMSHFEVRNYRSLMRHLVLSLVSLLFLNEQLEPLREKKSLVEHLPDQGRGRGAA